MATKLGTAYIPVEGDWNRFNRDLQTRSRTLTRSFSRIGTGLGKALTSNAAYAAGAGLALVGLEAKRAFEAFQESDKIGRQTNAVLKSTGGVANVTANRVSKLATAISRKTGVDDEAVQSGENLLLTFTQVRNEAGKGNKIFDRATRVITDMSVALGQDTKSSAIQVGKALNDPIKGVTALQRVGVSFTQQQRDQIKALVDGGKAADAQKLILAELTKEFGGSAAAQATATGKLKVAFGNLEEGLGKGLAPVVDSIATKLTNLAQDAEPKILAVSDAIGKLFDRKDLDLGDKLKLSRGKLQQALQPFITEGRASIDAMHLGDKLQRVIEEGAPRIADALAASAPRAAGAFVNAFKNASPWGKLLTAAFIIAKLGGFRAAGSWAGGILVSRIQGVLKRDTSMQGAAGAAGRRSGRAYATQTAATGATGITAASAPDGRLGKASSRAGRVAGRAMGLAGAAAFIVAFAPEIEGFLKEFGQRLKDATKKDANGKSFLDGLGDFFLDPFRGKGGKKQDLIDRVTGGPFPTGKGGAGLTRPGSGLGGLPRQSRPDEGNAPIRDTSRRRKRKARSSTRDTDTDTDTRTTTRQARPARTVRGSRTIDRIGTLHVRKLIVAHADGIATSGDAKALAGDDTLPRDSVTRPSGTRAERAAALHREKVRTRHASDIAKAKNALSSVGVLGSVAKFEDVNVDTTALRKFMSGKTATEPKRRERTYGDVHITVQAPKRGDGMPDVVAWSVAAGRELRRRGG